MERMRRKHRDFDGPITKPAVQGGGVAEGVGALVIAPFPENGYCFGSLLTLRVVIVQIGRNFCEINQFRNDRLILNCS